MPRVRDRDELRSNHWRRVVVPEVKRLYGWTCHICDQPINPSYKSPHPLSYSVDHIRGAATGFDLRYLRPAHRRCNMAQGDPTRETQTGVPQPKQMTQWGSEPIHAPVPIIRERFNPRRSRIKGHFAVPVTVVCGPPGAGKSTYVREAMQAADLVLDMDLIYRALTNGIDKPMAILPFAAEARDAVLARLSKRSDVHHAWIVTPAPRRSDREPYIAAGARIVLRVIDASECKRRIASDSARARDVDWPRLVDDWWRNYEP